ncbi:MAG: hypothetical protein RJS97_08800 [Parvibaculaceae bacterium]
MASQTTHQHETILRETFRRMDAARYQEIREAYYKAVEGLQSLANALEAAAEPSGESCDALINEHLVACMAIDAMNKSALGGIL